MDPKADSHADKINERPLIIVHKMGVQKSEE